MFSELSVIVKDDENDEKIKECVKEAVNNFEGRPESVKICINMDIE